MGLFDPDKQKYITRGIDAYVPIEVQIQIFESIERWRQQGVELDYLQVFKCSVETDAEGNASQIILHSQEVPDMCETIRFPVIGSGITEKIFVIDDAENSSYFTALLASEY